MKSKWLQSSLMLSFSATVLFSGHVGILKARIINERAQTISVPDPPQPLPDSASPYWAEIAPQTESEPASEPAASLLKLEIAVTEDAWVEVETDGQPSYGKLAHAGQTLSFQASERIRLMTGNAPGLDLRFNGEPVSSDGATGKVRAFEFTSAGTQLLKSGSRVSE